MNEKVIIVGAGAAGVGMGVVLKKMGVPFIILDKGEVGSTFLNWPKEMRFISPSFTGNFFNLPDLNAVTPDTSPAYSLQTEHPNGKQYASYLQLIAEKAELSVRTNCEVLAVTKQSDLFHVKTSDGVLVAENVVWAAGEFGWPNELPFKGAEHCIHNSKVATWSQFDGDSYVIIGGYESGVDAAYQLSAYNKHVVLLDAGDELSIRRSDSSYALSPYTRDNFMQHGENIRFVKNARVVLVEKNKSTYTVHLENGKSFDSPTRPILATGFNADLNIVDALFEKESGHALLTENDESTITPGLFLAGPKVQHKNDLFCFIYKFRQRFAVVGETIAGRLGKQSAADSIVEEYKRTNFYLRDLSCCGNECPC